MLPPLDSAVAVYRAQPFDPDVPSEGTLAVPLTVGPVPPVHTLDATLGDHWRYPLGQGCSASAALPLAALNGDVTFAVRYRPEALWADRLILAIIDPTTPNPTKHFMLHQTSSNKYMARFWEHPSVGWAQIGATSVLSASLTRTDTLVVTWDSAAKTVALYVNGVLEASGSTGKDRSEASSSPLHVPSAGTSLVPAYKVFSLAAWDFCLSPSEVAALTDNADWLAPGGDPPSPPELGDLIVRINGTVQPGATVQIDGEPLVPTTAADVTVYVDFA